MNACTAMFPQCMTRANNPADCNCPTAYSFRSDPDETKGRKIAREQAAVEARRSIGRKVELSPQSKLDQIRNVSNGPVFDIVPPVKSKPDQKLPSPVIMIQLTPDQVEFVRECADRDIETRFWSIVDRDGLTGLPSDMWAALDILVTRAKA